MAEKSQIIANLDWYTERVSNRVWSISAGVVVICLAYTVEGSGESAKAFLTPSQVAPPAILAIISLTCDMMQYVFGVRSHISLLNNMENNGAIEASYDKENVLYRAQVLSFNLKVSFCILAATWMILVIVFRVFGLL